MLHVHRHHRDGSAVQSVTSAPESLAQEQAHRIRRYLLTMAIRTVCFVGAAITASAGASAWLWGTLAIAAIVLPYIAVVFANAVQPRAPGRARPVLPDDETPPQIGPE
jgi:CHASE3 domain sensor protein